MTERLKGNAVIGQSGGPTCVINQSLVGAIKESANYPEIENFYGALNGLKGILDENFIDLKKEDPASLETIAVTPSAALGSVRMKPTEDDCRKVFDIFKKHNIRYFFYIGGNDSAETASIVNNLADEADYDFNVFHIPKTIDNDLLVTDHCPGFGSAAKFVASALMGDNLDNRSLPGIKIDIIMGRHAGFLTAASVLGRKYEDDGPHLVYLPERPFDLDQFTVDVSEIYNRLGRCLIAVSEGISRKDGQPVFTTGEKDSHGNVQLSGSGGLGDFLMNHLKSKIDGARVRSDTFGYLQRSFPGVLSETDAAEARLAGKMAVKYAVENCTDGSVALKRTGNGDNYGCETMIAELNSVAKHTKGVPDEFINDAGNNVTDAFVEYARPLAGTLPEIGRLAAVKV